MNSPRIRPYALAFAFISCEQPDPQKTKGGDPPFQIKVATVEEEEPYVSETLSSKPESSTQDGNKAQTDRTKEAQPIHRPEHKALAGDSLTENHVVEYDVRKDFNGDGTIDLAIIIQPKSRPQSDPFALDQARIFLVGLANKDMSRFRNISKSKCMAMCKECGGMMGDPFMGLKSNAKNNLQIRNYGGSRHRWANGYTIAWRKNDFYVIGFDEESFDTLDPNSTTSISVNLLTGKYKRNKSKRFESHDSKPITIADCKQIETLKNRTWK